MPELYIIAGCNGAGKTTASYTILPAILHCKEFINADEIAKGRSPFRPETVAMLVAESKKNENMIVRQPEKWDKIKNEGNKKK